jgi:hypothetical protein
MKVQKQTENDLEIIQLVDLEIYATSETIGFEIDGNWCDLDKKTMRELLPHLAAWCETGSLEVSDER